MTARYIVGDARDVLAQLEAASVDLVVTSPPFLALRSYLPAGHDQKALEIGSEATPADYLNTLLDVTEALARVLAPHGSLVVELGDTYAGNGGAGGDYGPGGWREGQPRFGRGDLKTFRDLTRWPLDKSLCLIPSLFAASLAYGRNLLRPERTTDRWRVRNVVAWCRPNPPVGALGDKYRPGTSYLTVACKARDRWFDLDAVREPLNMESPGNRYSNSRYLHSDRKHVGGIIGQTGEPARWDEGIIRGDSNPAGAPPLDWWEIPTEPYAGSHYATFPERLVVRPILSMCPERVCTVCGQPSRRIVNATYEPHGERHDEPKGVRGYGVVNGEHAQHMAHGRATKLTETVGWSDCGHDQWRRGVVCDPFAGSGTTLAVAEGHGRDSIGIDLDARNRALALERCGLFMVDV